MANTHSPEQDEIRIALEGAQLALQEAVKHSNDVARGFILYASQQVRVALSKATGEKQ